MTKFAQTARHVAMALSVLFAALAILFASRYLREHGGWDTRVRQRRPDDDHAVGAGIRPLTLDRGASARRAECQRDAADIGDLDSRPAGCTAFHLAGHRRLTPLAGSRWDDCHLSPGVRRRFLPRIRNLSPTYDYQVPTGIFLQSFEFLNSNNVEMTGFVWQLYGPEIPDQIMRGVVFPEAVQEAYQAEEVWRVEEEDGTEQIGWYFSGTFRQNFDYRLYPFDRQDIWLRIWSPEPAEGVMPVPDFDAYRDLTPSTLPGIDTQFVYGGWDPLSSAFSYDLIDYNVDFGLSNEFSGAPDPELYFNLSVARDFLGPMLEHLVLEGAIAILLFFLLLLMAHDSDLQDRIGLTIFDLIVASGGLLFAVILDLNAIRDVVESQDLTYLEWFPLILAFFIVLVVLTAVLRVKHWRLPLIGYSGDLVPVLAYWPALIGSLLALTLLVFFY